MKVLFRVDASVRIGSGHLMRCLTLAKAMRRQGWQCSFVCRLHPGHLLELISSEGFAVLPLPLLPNPPTSGYGHWLGATQQQDASTLKQALTQKVDWLVIDHYGLAAEFEQLMSSHARHCLVIDDLADRAHHCDVLLDQNLLPEAGTRYHGLLPDRCIQLLGPAYALLRDEFYRQYDTKRQPHRLLVFFGGTDADNLTARTLKALKALKFPGLNVDIVIGATNPARRQIEQLCAGLPDTELHIQCNDMARLMYRAGLMLGAGGGTHWERCKCGLAGLVVTVAENQVATTRHLAQIGACIWLGQEQDISELDLTEQLRYYLSNPELLQNVAGTAAGLIPETGGVQAVIRTLQTFE